VAYSAGGFFRPASISWLGRMIRSHRLRCVAFGTTTEVVRSNSGRIMTHGSVRVEFESTRPPNTGSKPQRIRPMKLNPRPVIPMATEVWRKAA
jgi:hypothetical protein